MSGKQSSETGKQRPSGWSEFWDHECDSNTVRMVSIFGSRYLLFHELSSSAFDGETSKSDSYYILLKVSLAYSTIEALEKLTGRGQVGLEDPRLAAVIQSFGANGFKTHLSKSITSPTLKQSLTDFFEDPRPSDLRPVVTAIRHGFFHPNLSASGLGLLSSAALRNALLTLIGVIDRQIEANFTTWSAEHLSNCAQVT